MEKVFMDEDKLIVIIISYMHQLIKIEQDTN